MKRASSLMITPRFSFRSSKHFNDDDVRTPWTPSRGVTASECGHTTRADLVISKHVNVIPSPNATCPKRAKFSLEPLDTSRPPPSSYHGLGSTSSIVGGENPNFAAPTSPKRRWTLAMAITDEGITDEVLVKEFERMRMKREVTDQDLDLDEEWDVWEADRGAAPGMSDSSQALLPTEDPGVSKIPYTSSLPSFPTHNPLPASRPATRSATTPSATWHAARRALLTCRELVRTERHYLTSIQSLLANETATAPPALMLRYIEELASISQALLQHMEEDPSAWGVAAAFLAVEHGLESAFVAWCGVVGVWFEGQAGTPKRKGNKMAFVGLSDDQAADGNGKSPLKRSVSTWRISVPSLNSIGMTPMTSPVTPSAFLSRRKAKEQSPSPSSPSGTPKRRSSVRDLAILPTQRIMRYVLLYRDLLDYTPATSPSRALVERAVEAACRITQKCDRAQGNAAFLQKR